MPALIICSDVIAGDSGYYFIGYSAMADGYRHAYMREVPGSRLGKTEVKLTRDPNHPSDPRCPGCVEKRCATCGDSTHPSLTPCLHQPGGREFRERMNTLYKKNNMPAYIRVIPDE